MGKHYRTHFFNSLGGFKSVALCGTTDGDGNNNLAIMSSVIHVGANPPLTGLLIRPAVVTRNTLENIMNQKCFTLNHLHPEFFKRAHQTSARYPRGVSEFEQTGLTPEFSGTINAPYVAESRIKWGMELREKHLIKTNDTIFLVGEIIEAFIPEEVLAPDGFIDIAAADSLTVAGLDAYHSALRITRLSYARPGQPLKQIEPL